MQCPACNRWTQWTCNKCLTAICSRTKCTDKCKWWAWCQILQVTWTSNQWWLVRWTASVQTKTNWIWPPNRATILTRNTRLSSADIGKPIRTVFSEKNAISPMVKKNWENQEILWLLSSLLLPWKAFNIKIVTKLPEGERDKMLNVPMVLVAVWEVAWEEIFKITVWTRDIMHLWVLAEVLSKIPVEASTTEAKQIMVWCNKMDTTDNLNNKISRTYQIQFQLQTLKRLNADILKSVSILFFVFLVLT